VIQLLISEEVEIYKMAWIFREPWSLVAGSNFSFHIDNPQYVIVTQVFLPKVVLQVMASIGIFFVFMDEYQIFLMIC